MKRAFILYSTLVIAALLMMLAGSIVNAGLVNTHNGWQLRDRGRAREMACGGINHILQMTTYQPSYTSDTSYQVDDEGYTITFSNGQSINNIPNATATTATDVDGVPVPPYTLDFVVTGTAGHSTVRLHCVAAQGYYFQQSLGADGQVSISGNCVLNGIVGLSNPSPTGGGIFSNFQTTVGNPAIALAGNVVLAPTALIETRPAAAGGGPTVTGLGSQYLSQEVTASTPSQSVPEFQVATVVAAQSAAPAPAGLTSGAGGYFSNSTMVNDTRYVNGNLTIVGDLNLAGGSLYVNGTLTMNGGIIGVGSVYVNGNVSVNGGVSSVQTNQSSGAALFSSGNVTMTGINAYAYLQTLAGANSQIATDQAALTSALATLNTAYTNPPDVNTPHNANGVFDNPGWSNTYANPAPTYRLVPIPGPDGSYSIASGDDPPLTLASDIRTTLGSGLATNPQAQQLVHGLEELAYASRMSFNEVPPADVTLPFDNSYHTSNIASVTASPGVTNVNWSSGTTTGLTATWDDGPLMADPTSGYATTDWSDFWPESEAAINLKQFQSLTEDHQARAIGGTSGTFFSSPGPSQSSIQTQYKNQLAAFTANNPANLTWLSNSTYQGLVFAQGNVNVSNSFQIMGAVLSNGNINITGNSTLTYDQEYFHQQGNFGPLQVQMVEDLTQ